MIDEKVGPLAQLHEELESGAAFIEAAGIADNLLDESFAQQGIELNDAARVQLRQIANEVLPLR